MTELSEKLYKFKKIIEAYPEMYKYAEVYITIFDGYIIELFSIIRNQNPEEARVLKKLRELDLKIIKECWNIKTLFSNIQKDKIELESLHGTFPFWWSDKESDTEDGLCRPELIKIPEIENPKFISSNFKEQYYIYCYRQQNTSVRNWLKQTGQKIKSMGYSSLSDLYNDVIPYYNYRNQNLLNLSQAGFDILVPIYLKLKSCGVNENRILELTVESIGITKDAEIHISDTNNEPIKSFIIKDGEPVHLENREESKYYKVSWEVPEKYEELKVELFLTSDTSVVSLNVITNIKKEIEKFNDIFSKWAIRENKIINYLKRHSLFIFSSFAVILLLGLLIFIYFIGLQNYLAIAQTIGVIVNVGLVYVIFRTYIRDMKERDHETAEKTLTKLTDLKYTYEKYKRLTKYSLIYGLEERKPNDCSFFQLTSLEFFANNYIPLEIRNFVIEEMPEILEEHRKLMEQLNKYVLNTMNPQIQSETENEINSIIQKCDAEISRLTREYRLDLFKQEPLWYL